jgi:ubiquinone/menaquinone biosynthesis C-methylase UbiE
MAPVPESISFDRVANIYDSTRSLPTDVSSAITAAMLEAVRGAGARRVLEVGVGTGRIARPLIAAGVPLTGVDISRPMMGRLLAQLDSAPQPPDLLLGDATALPFGDRSFDAVLAVHVLHLVSSMSEAVREIRRVLCPGGIFLHQTRRPGDEATRRLWEETDEWWTEALAARGFRRRHRPQPPNIRAHLLSTGATLDTRDVAEQTYSHTVAEDLEDIRGRVHSWTWEVPDNLLYSLLPDFEAWIPLHFESSNTDYVAYELESWRWP